RGPGELTNSFAAMWRCDRGHRVIARAPRPACWNRRVDDDHRRVPMPAERYDEQWKVLAASGQDVHGEAALVDALLGGPPARVLDAGCGTGRVAIELDRRGYDTVGLDVDPALLERARSKAPGLTWQEADL